MPSTRTTARALTLGAALAVAALTLSAAPTAASLSHASASRAIPAVGPVLHHRDAGLPLGPDHRFACQKTSPAQCYGPQQIRHAYGYDKLLAKGIDGRGSTIVIVDAFSAPLIRSDLHAFDHVFGLADPTLNIFAPQGLTRFDPTDQDQVNWSGEISLDVEWAHAIAPRATIDLVLARTPADLDTTVQWVADHGGGDVVSLSWGSDDRCPASRSPHAEFAQLTRNGTTVFASAGDTGAAEHSCDGSTWVRAAGSPASDPNVTAVGGTDLRANGITGAYRSETVWNEGTDAVGGSGLSAVYREPAFQRGVQSTGWRSVPDVSYHAATRNGVLIAWSEGGGNRFQSFGGTSSGCPQWAATVALADQLAGHRLGNINPWLYHLAATVGQSALFHDVTRGNTSVTEVDANNNPVSIPGDSAGKGWDFATGFGSPRADVLVPLLARGA